MKEGNLNEEYRGNEPISSDMGNFLFITTPIENKDTQQRLLEPIRRQSNIKISVSDFVNPLALPVNQPTREQKVMVADELREKQNRIENLEEELRAIKRLLPDEGTKIEQVLYENPLESVAVLLMIYDHGSASLEDVEEICGDKALEVICNCVKNGFIQSSGNKMTLTLFGENCVSKWARMLQQPVGNV